MSKIQSIRDALAGGPLAFRKLHEAVGGVDKQLRDLLYAYGREIKVGKDDDRTVSLKARRSPPPKRKKPAGKSAKKTTRRPFKKLADRLASSGNGASLRDLVLDNFLVAGAELRKAVRDQVDGVEDDEILMTALANHERAEQLHAAARTA